MRSRGRTRGRCASRSRSLQALRTQEKRRYPAPTGERPRRRSLKVTLAPEPRRPSCQEPTLSSTVTSVAVSVRIVTTLRASPTDEISIALVGLDADPAADLDEAHEVQRCDADGGGGRGSLHSEGGGERHGEAHEEAEPQGVVDQVDSVKPVMIRMKATPPVATFTAWPARRIRSAPSPISYRLEKASSTSSAATKRTIRSGRVAASAQRVLRLKSSPAARVLRGRAGRPRTARRRGSAT